MAASSDLPNRSVVIRENIPSELRERSQWLAWRYAKRGAADKPTKIPVSAKSGSTTDVRDRSQWATFDEALALYSTDLSISGIGFAFCSDDPFVGIDLDGVLVDGVPNPLAQEFLDELASYAEVTPSGTGLHIIAKGQLPVTGSRRGNVELYDHDRYFTVTGQKLETAPDSITDCQNEINRLHGKYVAAPAPVATIRDTPIKNERQTDSAVLSLARNAKNGDKFAALYDRGELSMHDGDHSRADNALCALLAFWTRKDERQCDILFRQSALMRHKWDERHSSDGSTYGELTIRRAVAACQDVYSPSAPAASVVELVRSTKTTPAFIDARTLCQTPYAEPEFLVEHLIPKRSIVLLTGDSGAGKSSFCLQLSIAASCGLPFCEHFPVYADGRSILYVNAEMALDTLKRFVIANARGIGIDPLDIPEQLIFDGAGRSSLVVPRDGNGAHTHLEDLIRERRPCLVVFDTLRALFEADENKQQEVRAAFTWLRALTETYDCSVLVLHHQRKLNAVSNGQRERVSGSRDLIASVDVHLALKAQNGHVGSRLVLDKSRTPYAGVSAGHEWDIVARWEDGAPPRSVFIARDPEGADSSATSASEVEVLALLADGPRTVKELGADGGSRKRAFEKLRADGVIKESGKSGRAVLWSLGGDQVDQVRGKPRSNGRLNLVNDATKFAEKQAVDTGGGRHPEASPSAVTTNNLVIGQHIYKDQVQVTEFDDEQGAA